MSDSFLIFSGTTLAEGTLGRFLNITRGVLMRIKVRGRLQAVENVQLGHGTIEKGDKYFPSDNMAADLGKLGSTQKDPKN